MRETTKNVSLAGVYFETNDGKSYRLHDAIMTSISIPTSQTGQFPFTRLAGRGRVVRVSELSSKEPSASGQHGIALEFGEDLTALTALPLQR